MTPESAGVRGAMLLAAAILISGAIVLILPPLFARLPAMESAGAVALVVASATIVIYGLIGLAGFFGLRRSGDAAGLGGHDRARWLVVGLGVGLGGLLLAAADAAIAGNVRSPGVPHTTSPFLWLLGTGAVVFQSAVEELFFRGWLQRGLRRLWGAWPAIAASAATFGFLHILGGARAPLSVLNITLAGLLFGLLAERSGGLAAPIAAHAAWNWAEQMLLGLDPNPGVGPFGALLDRDLVGSGIWGGSTEGLNGSLGTTFVLVALILPLALAAPSFKGSPARG